MTRPRPTIRRLMVAVAVVAVVLALFEWMGRRGRHFGRLAYENRTQAELNEVSWAVGNRNLPYRTLAAHRRKLQEKYERAARYPWLTVAPDPPEPQD